MGPPVTHAVVSREGVGEGHGRWRHEGWRKGAGGPLGEAAVASIEVEGEVTFGIGAIRGRSVSPSGDATALGILAGVEVDMPEVEGWQRALEQR